MARIALLAAMIVLAILQSLKADPPQSQKALLQAKLEASEKAYKDASEQFGLVRRVAGNKLYPLVQPEEVHIWSLRWMDDRCALAQTKKERLSAVEDHVQRMKELRGRIDSMTPDGCPSWSTSAGVWYVAEAEIELARRKELVVPQAALKRRLAGAKDAYTGVWESFGTFKDDRTLASLTVGEDVYTWSSRWLFCEREKSESPLTQLVAVRDHVQRIRDLKKRSDNLDEDQSGMVFHTAMRWYVAEAEIAIQNGSVAFFESRLESAMEVRSLHDSLGVIRRVRRVSPETLIQQNRLRAQAFLWPERAVDAKWHECETWEDRVACLKEHLVYVKRMQQRIAAWSEFFPVFSQPAAAWLVADAELRLLREESKGKHSVE